MIYILFILGSVLGSFTSCLAIRRTRGESIIYPPSHCDNCGKKLKIKELIPIVSYIKLKGRCSCGAKIGIEKILSELLTGVLFSIYYQKHQGGFCLYFFVLIYLLLLEISIIDYITLTAYEGDLIIILLIGLVRQIYNFYYGIFFISIAIIQILLLILYFYITKKEFTIIGEGDLLLFASLLSFFEPIQGFYFLAISSWLALLPAIHYWKRGKRKIPMLPFISLSFIICIIRWGM